MRASIKRIEEANNKTTYDDIKDGNKDNQREGVKVGQNVVGKPVSAHRCSLRRKVVVQLVIRQPYA